MAKPTLAASMPEFLLENRTARLTILLDPRKKVAFEALCSRLDTTPSQLLRQMIRECLAEHGVAWNQSAPDDPPDGKAPK